MKNIISADVYRIVRSKGLYITFGVLIAILLLFVGIDAMWRDMPDSEVFMFLPRPADIQYFTHGMTMLFSNASGALWLLLPLVIIAAAPIFTHGTVKNDIAAGIPRTKLFVSKLIICAVLCAVVQFLFMSLGVLMFLGFGGRVGTLPTGFWLEFLQSYGAQLFMLLAATFIGVFLVFVTKRSGAVIGAYIGIFALPEIIFAIFFTVNYDFAMVFSRFDISTSIVRLGMGFLDTLTTPELSTRFIVAAVYLIATCAGGIALFKRAEIK